jgi:GntR family transcriptional regulator
MIAVDKSQPTPAYLQLQERLRSAILAGEIAPGEALPSERELAESLGLSRMTVRRALGALVAQKLAEKRQGSGTYVLPRRLEQTVDRVLGFADEAKLLGFEPGSRILETLTLPADPQVAEALKLAPEAPVCRITRLRTADGAPLALQLSHLPPPYTSLSAAALAASGSLYRTLAETFDLVPRHARQTVSARMPTQRERELLELPRGVPVLALERTTFCSDHAPFEFVRSAYRGDKYQLGLELRAP